MAAFNRRQTGVAENAGQEIVEIVGDAAGEHADALEFLAFEEFALEFEFPLLGPPPVRHVDGQSLDEGELAVGGEDPRAAVQHPAYTAVLVPDAVLDFESLLLAQPCVHGLGRRAVVGGIDQVGVGDSPAGEILGRVAGEREAA